MAKRRNVQSFLAELDIPAESESTLSPDAICLPPQQPRRYFDPAKISQLAASIQKYGILEPLLVRPQGDKYELVAGERRYRAAQQVGLTELPVVIRQLNDQEALALSLIENLQREDLNPVEETEGILSLIGLELGISQGEVTAQLYKMRNESRASDNVVTNSDYEIIQSIFSSLGLLSWDSFITHRLPLLKLPSEVTEALRSGKIAYTKATAIARVKDEKARKKLLRDAIKHNWSLSEIRERIKALRPSSEILPLKSRWRDTSSRLQKAKVWENPDKQQQLEELLSQIEALIESE